MKYGFFFLFMLLAPLLKAQDLYLVPTLHRLHQVNEQYNYDSLRQLITQLNPDVIAVEIRTEDLEQDTVYLKKSYPYEMWMERYWFPDKTIVGFDWLGSDIAGKPIPENYWQDISSIKLLQKKLNNDSSYNTRCAPCDTLTKARLPLLQTLSLRQLLKSRDAALTNAYYICLEAQLRHTPYAAIPAFFELRNQKILARIKAIQKRYPGKKIVVLTGADHYAYLIGRIQHVPLP